MVSWKKIHSSENLGELVDDLDEAQVVSFAIVDVMAYDTFIILQSGFKGDKIAGLRAKYQKPSEVAEFIYKKFKGDVDAMEAFVRTFNAGIVSVIDDSGEDCCDEG